MWDIHIFDQNYLWVLKCWKKYYSHDKSDLWKKVTFFYGFYGEEKNLYSWKIRVVFLIINGKSWLLFTKFCYQYSFFFFAWKNMVRRILFYQISLFPQRAPMAKAFDSLRKTFFLPNFLMENSWNKLFVKNSYHEKYTFFEKMYLPRVTFMSNVWRFQSKKNIHHSKLPNH